MWNLKQALQIIKIVQKIAPKYNYNCALTGSVIFKGISNKDIDIILYNNKSTVVSNLSALRFELVKLGFIKWEQRLHHKQLDFKIVFKCEYKGKRIDFILP